VYRLDLEQCSTNRLPKNPTPSIEHVAMGVTYALAVRQASAEGVYELEAEFLAYELEIKMDGKVAMGFDSAASSTNDARNPVAGSFRKIIGSRVRLRAHRDNTAGQFVDREQWRRTVITDGAESVAHILAQQFNEGFFQQMTDFGKALPDKPVAVGDSWPFSTEV